MVPSSSPRILKANSKKSFLVNAAMRRGATKICHLRAYGDNVNFIGTRNCVTCVGVYFEIFGNRCFCAHINAWMSDDNSGEAVTPGGATYQEINEQVYNRMRVHAEDHGWDASEYIQGSLRLVCPLPHVLGYAVQDALQRFLGFARRPFTPSKQHGFMVMPQTLNEQNEMEITYLRTRLRHPNNDQSRPKQLYYDPVPDNFDTVPWRDEHDRGMPVEWNYSAGTDRGWHVYHANGTKTYKKY